MRLDFYIDPETGEPHIHRHRVSEHEVGEVLMAEGLRWHEGGGKWSVLGRTEAGRILPIIVLEPDPASEPTFVLTAYAPKKELVAAFRRRMRKKGTS